MPLEPCEKHEITNCSFCTGAERVYQQSLAEPLVDRGVAPRIPGGPTIFANYPGTCTSCGRCWEEGDPIHRPHDGDGWIGVECCATNPPT